MFEGYSKHVNDGKTKNLKQLPACSTLGEQVAKNCVSILLTVSARRRFFAGRSARLEQLELKIL